MPDNIFTLNCELCKGGHHEAKIILCDQCDRGCHLFCLNPPLEEVPEGHWVCPLCIEAEAEGGAFRQGEEYSMSEFEQIAGDFQRQYFKDHDTSTGPVSLPMTTMCWPILNLGKSLEAIADLSAGGSLHTRPAMAACMSHMASTAACRRCCFRLSLCPSLHCTCHAHPQSTVQEPFIADEWLQP